MALFNIFRLSADACHLISKIVLVATIHLLKSAEGISLSTQWLYLLVFMTRYLDIFWQYQSQSAYNTTMKIIYVVGTMYTIYLMIYRYPPAYKETRWAPVSIRVGALVLFSVVACFIVNRIFGYTLEFGELVWDFSQPLESVAIIPQLSLLTNLKIPTVITTYYLIPLGLYRFLYILNWIYRYFDSGSHYWDPMSVIFGILQTALYAEFFWIYWRRQKIRLREGNGELDDEDLRKGWFLGRILGMGGRQDQDVEQGRGQSVRADDGLLPREEDYQDEDEARTEHHDNINNDNNINNVWHDDPDEDDENDEGDIAAESPLRP